MIRISLSSMCLLLLVAVAGTSCIRQSQSSAPPGDTIPLAHASFLTLTEGEGYKVAILRDPWDTLRTLHTYVLVPKADTLPAVLPEGTLVRTPLTKAVVYSSVHCSLLEQLGVLPAIAGVCDRKYIALPALQKRCEQGWVTDCGDSMSPDIERMIELHPDAILLSPFENSGGYGRVEQLGVPLVECADYMETSPLGRAEWMRFYGMLFGAEARADSLFAVVSSNYARLKARADTASNRPTVFCELKSSGAWYVPGGQSTVGQMLADAGARYVFADDHHSGSVPLSFETVFDRAGEADIWLFKYNRDRDMTYADLRGEFEGYTAFRVFRERHIYACNTGHTLFYEETPFRPDLLLADYLQMFHPEWAEMEGLRYYHTLK